MKRSTWAVIAVLVVVCAQCSGYSDPPPRVHSNTAASAAANAAIPDAVRREQRTPFARLATARTLKLLSDKQRRIGDLPQAARYYKVAATLVRDDPSDAASDLCSRCDMNIAHCHWLLGDYKAGLRQCTAHLLWQGSHISDQQLANCLVRRARCLAGLQKIPLAAADLRRALSLRPDYDVAQKELEQLQSLHPAQTEEDEGISTSNNDNSKQSPDPVALYHMAVGQEDDDGYLSVDASEEEVEAAIEEMKAQVPALPSTTTSMPFGAGDAGSLTGLGSSLLQAPPSNMTAGRMLEMADDFLARFEDPASARMATMLVKNFLTEEQIKTGLAFLPEDVRHHQVRRLVKLVRDWNERTTMVAARWCRLTLHALRVLNNVRRDAQKHAQLIGYVVAFVWFVGATV